MPIREDALELHEKYQGKIEIHSKVPIQNKADLSLAYTPGVAEPCKEIAKNPSDVYKYTSKGRFVAIVTDGSAVLGLGNIGPLAALPVMEGKALLLKRFADVDAFPICLKTQDPKEIAHIIEMIAPSFGGINLEDIAAPFCVEVENILKEKLDIPLFHDDQHGTAIVVTAALINALKVVKKKAEDCTVVICGAGASGTAITKMLLPFQFKDIILTDIHGILHRDDEKLNWLQKEMTQVTNKENQKGTLEQALKGADIFIGVAVGNIVTANMISQMNKDSIVLALANPIPEIMPLEAKKGGARIVGTGRSDFPNQVNNVLALPGVFKGTFDVRANRITEEMKNAAAKALASLIEEKDLSEDYIIADAFDERVVKVVSAAVSQAYKMGQS